MNFPRPLQNLIDHANAVNASGSRRFIKMEATVITPVDQIPLLIPNGFGRNANFAGGASDDCEIRAQIQPGVYMKQILPYKDNLYIEVVNRVGYTQTMTRYRATPLGDTNPEMQGNDTALADLIAKDDLNMVTVSFQLLEPGFALLKNELVTDNFLMAKLDKVIHGILTEYGNLLNLTGPDKFRGVNIETPFDNDRTFGRISIPAAVPLVILAKWFQQHEEFGFYSKGMGQYYRKGMWYIYPLYKVGRYETARKTVDIYRLPQNVFPTIENSYFIEGNKMTILSTGEGDMADNRDIQRQNQGMGYRVTNPEAIMGETGRYYNKGQNMTTRGDSLAEFQTSKRKSGEEMVPFSGKPSSNLCKLLSKNAYNDGQEMEVEWHNSFADWIEPDTPCRYFYMSGSETLTFKEGSITNLYTELRMDTQSQSPVFREHSKISFFINNEEKTVQ